MASGCSAIFHATTESNAAIGSFSQGSYAGIDTREALVND